MSTSPKDAAPESIRRILEEKLRAIDDRRLDGRVIMVDGPPSGGSYGLIYRGTYTSVGQTCDRMSICVKVLKCVDFSNPHVVNRLCREMRVWFGLTHAHVVRLLGWTSHLPGQEAFSPGLISPWCDGGDDDDDDDESDLYTA